MAEGSDHDSISSVSADPDSDSGEEADVQPRRMPQICLLVQQITGQVRALYDLSSLLRRPNVTDKYIKSVQSKARKVGPLSGQVLDFSRVDLRYIEEKVSQWRGLTKSSCASRVEEETVAPVEEQTEVPGIEDLAWFCRRLAGANTRRREQLSYWADHPYDRDFTKTYLVEDSPAPAPPSQPEESRSQASTIKGPVQSAISTKTKTTFSKQSFSTTAVSDIVDSGSNTRPRTVYAPSAVEHSQSNAIPPPPTPEETQSTFRCPYCGMSLDCSEMKDRQLWK